MVIKLGSTDINKLYLGSTEINKCYLGTTLFYDKTGGGPAPALDPDAEAYITAVETADGQTLEDPVKTAINNFVLGCKADGIWAAIKASCILAGARTLSGALVPLTGDAPTNFNFVSDDYDRKTGLVGDKSTKYLDSNRSNTADPQNDSSLGVYVSEVAATGAPSFLLASSNTSPGATAIGYNLDTSVFYRNRNTAAQLDARIDVNGGFIGMSRSASTEYVARYQGTNTTYTQTSQTPNNRNVAVFTEGEGLSYKTTARLAFYSIGESLDLAQLDTRVSNLITAIGEAIP